ncbi:MAG: AmpG family muropeptide MFS transporter, partial [Betaproteobacteria bacterium]|nr:AmpG family muropeptide MFS transporter [Betaproteobacteria bacterium]
MTEKTTTDAFSWLASWRIYLQPASVRMLLLGFAAGLPLLLVLGTLSFR